jgi:hypothetical protein
VPWIDQLRSDSDLVTYPCCRLLSPRMLAIRLFTSLHPNVRPEDLPPLERGLLQQCATAELLGWLLESAVIAPCGEPAPGRCVWWLRL